MGMRRWLGLGGALIATATAHAGLMVGQVDDFQDGTTQNWTVGGPSPLPPSVVLNGGPNGAGDAYLLLQSIGGGGPGSRLSAQNVMQWTGDYTAAGITGIALDLRNLGATEIWASLRLEGGGGATYQSLNPIVLAPGGDWISAVLPINAGELVGGGDLAALLGNLTRLRIEDNRTPFVAQLGIDNIRAIPEPASLTLLATAALLALRRR